MCVLMCTCTRACCLFKSQDFLQQQTSDDPGGSSTDWSTHSTDPTAGMVSHSPALSQIAAAELEPPLPLGEGGPSDTKRYENVAAWICHESVVIQEEVDVQERLHRKKILNWSHCLSFLLRIRRWIFVLMRSDEVKHLRENIWRKYRKPQPDQTSNSLKHSCHWSLITERWTVTNTFFPPNPLLRPALPEQSNVLSTLLCLAAYLSHWGEKRRCRNHPSIWTSCL